MARKRVIDVTADSTLSKNQSGALVTLGKAAGITLKLPNAGRGLEYEIVVKTAVTSNAYKIIGNDSASMRGAILASTAGENSLLFVGNGTNHVAVSMNGSTSGGLIGTNLKFVCDNDGVWNVVGQNVGSGTVVTPWSTS